MASLSRSPTVSLTIRKKKNAKKYYDPINRVGNTILGRIGPDDRLGDLYEGDTLMSNTDDDVSGHVLMSHHVIELSDAGNALIAYAKAMDDEKKSADANTAALAAVATANEAATDAAATTAATTAAASLAAANANGASIYGILSNYNYAGSLQRELPRLSDGIRKNPTQNKENIGVMKTSFVLTDVHEQDVDVDIALDSMMYAVPERAPQEYGTLNNAYRFVICSKDTFEKVMLGFGLNPTQTNVLLPKFAVGRAHNGKKAGHGNCYYTIRY